MPFYVWPDIDPFRESPSILDAVIAPGTASQVAEATTWLHRARELVRQARAGAELASSTHPIPFASRHLRCATLGDAKHPIVRSSI